MPVENMKALKKTFDILGLFIQERRELSVTEISKTLSLNQATVSRILSKLADRGYLKQNNARGKYHIGNIYLEFSDIIKSQSKIRDAALPYLYELSRKTKYPVILAQPDTIKSIVHETFYDPVSSYEPHKIISREGTSLPLYCSSVGKVILAGMSNEELKGYLAEVNLEKKTPNTTTSLRELKKNLDKIRKDGVAFDDEEYILGLRSIAAGVTNNKGDIVGVISVTAPSLRMSISDIEKFKPLLLSITTEISRRL